MTDKVEIPEPVVTEPGGSQADMDRAVFEANTALAKAQLDKATANRTFVEPEAGAEDERTTKLNIELPTAKAQVDAGVTDDHGLFDNAKAGKAKSA